VIAAAAGLAAAADWTVLTAPPAFDAAVEIDHRCALKERVSSTLALPEQERATEAGSALAADAQRRVARVDVADKFRFVWPRQMLLPLLPAAVAALAALLVPPAGDAKVAPATAATQTPPPQVKKSTEDLKKELAQRRQKAEKQGLKDATELLRKLEEGSRELAREPQRDKALVKLNDLARQLRDRRQEVGGAERMKQQLEQLKSIDRGPAEKFAQALAHGDFAKAAQELEKLKDELAKDKLDAGQKEALAKQLDQMKQKLDQLAAARQAAQKDLEKRLDQARQAGQLAEANKLEEQLSKLAQQAPQMQQLQKIAEKLGQCSKCMRDGKGQQAAAGMAQAGEELKSLAQQLDELETLDGAMDQLGKAREEIAGQCAGGMGEGQPDGPPGPGLGQGPGDGARPEQKTKTSMYDSQVRQKVGRGSATVTDLVSGPNVKGKVEAEIQQQFDSTRRGSTDPLTGRHMPRKHSEHAREYFDQFREGK
jgi:hypothetical protein